ncbi:TraR/DksA family transcriptional regulator [Geobacter sp.]|uniref:TraR/DksA family transcriptional regulator n=1 Tax=Geobacter sp. TaxID=46610 RepID=UPI002634509E|nr:TraR/DksA family transcriptional regulator [Geobacter sp.]
MVEKQEEMKALLLKTKEEILAGISKAMKSGSETPTGEPTGDIYDQASSERDRELGLLLNDRERDKLRQIDEALLRIEDGEYGICEECEEEIPLGRLKVMPFARFCVRCQSEMEKLQAQTRRFEEDRAYREISFNEEEEG